MVIAEDTSYSVAQFATADRSDDEIVEQLRGQQQLLASVLGQDCERRRRQRVCGERADKAGRIVCRWKRGYYYEFAAGITDVLAQARVASDALAQQVRRFLTQIVEPSAKR